MPYRSTAARFAAALMLLLPALLHGQATPREPAGEAASACHVDLSGDGAVDTVVLFERAGRHRLVALIADG